MNILIYAVLILALFFVLVMAVDCNRFVIKEYKCRSSKLRKDALIVLLSDLHGKSFGKNNEKLIRAIDELQPDMILTAGDMYTSMRGSDTKTAEHLVTELASRYPIYYGNGNHEQKTRIFPEEYGSMYEDYSEKLREAGVRQLVNEKSSLLDYHMDIYGSEIERGYYGKFKRVTMEPSYLEKTLGKPDRERFSILIAHNPDYFESYAAWGADLVVAGHVHGGLMNLPVLGGVLSPALRFFPKYDGGEFTESESTMILSRGLGTHTLPIRIFNPGELVVIRLESSGKQQA